MSWPLYQKDVFDYPTAMALATVAGFLFGFVLERAGFGRARNLAAQFYGTDMRVLKVMFSAIVTATVGLGLLGAVGVVDLATVQIPETYWLPQLVGGLLLGVGFIVSGYCPGTAVVATASGNMDGVFSIIGVMVGAVAFAFGFPALEAFYLSGHLGPLTLPDLVGVSWAVMAAGVVAMAVAAFLFAEWVERLLARRRGEDPPASLARTRRGVFAGFGVAASAGVIASLAPVPPQTPAQARTIERINAIELASRLAADPRGLWLVDLRDPAACNRARIMGAMCKPVEDADGRFIADLPETRTLVIYGTSEAQLPAAVQAFPGRVALLTGGFDAFKQDILTAPAPPASSTAVAVGEYRKQVALHGFFTGQKTAAPPAAPRVKATRRKVRKGGGC